MSGDSKYPGALPDPDRSSHYQQGPKQSDVPDREPSRDHRSVTGVLEARSHPTPEMLARYQIEREADASQISAVMAEASASDRLEQIIGSMPDLSDLDRARFEDTMSHAYAPNTLRGIRKAVQYYVDWLYARDLDSAIHFPEVRVSDVLLFITDHAYGPPPEVDSILVRTPEGRKKAPKTRPGPLSFATITNRVKLLSLYLGRMGHPSLMDHPTVKKYLRLSRRAMARSESRAHLLPVQTKAITPERLHRLLLGLDAQGCAVEDSMRIPALRDRAIFLVGFGAGGRRRSEVAAIRIKDLEDVELPSGEVTFRLRQRTSKTDQEGRGRSVVMPPMASQAVREWLRATDIKDGYLFRALSRWGRPLERGVTGHGIYQMMKSRFLEVGVTDLSPHSLRAGFITEAGRQGRSASETMAMTGHTSVQVFQGYFEEGAQVNNTGIEVLGEAMARFANRDGSS